jgi:hypothetical protein
MIPQRAAGEIASLAPELDASTLKSVTLKQLLHEIRIAAPANDQTDRDMLRQLAESEFPELSRCRGAGAGATRAFVEELPDEVPEVFGKPSLLQIVHERLDFGAQTIGPATLRDESCKMLEEPLKLGRVCTFQHQRGPGE